MKSSSSVDNIISEFNTNPRLRVGVWAIAAVLGIYGILLLQDAVAEQSARYLAQTKKIARVEVLSDQKEWGTRLESARVVAKELEDRLWHEKTQGLAQAAFQDWVAQTLQQTGVTRPQVNVGIQEFAKLGGETTTSDLWQASAKLNFDFEPKALANLLGRLAAHDKLVVVQNLSVRSTPTPRVEMLLVGYVARPKEIE